MQAHYVSTVTVRLTRAHETQVLAETDAIHVLIPGLLVNLRDLGAALQMRRIWRRATPHAARVFNGEAAAAYEIPGWENGKILTHSSVTLSGSLSGVQIYGKTARYSRSKCGELKIQIASLTIVCDDRGAFDRQSATWEQAATLACQVWPRP